MELSRLDKQILKFIHNSYPIVYDPSEANRVIAIKERPLQTEKDIQLKFSSKTADNVIKAIQHLMAFQCIKEVYLYAQEDFVEQNIGPGRKIRHVALKQGEGHNGYQVTGFGEKVINDFISERFKRWIGKLIGTFLEKHFLLILVFLLGILFSSLFGWNLRAILKQFTLD
jgi:hypothetical protein